jgi:hypothetical protein
MGKGFVCGCCFSSGTYSPYRSKEGEFMGFTCSRCGSFSAPIKREDALKEALYNEELPQDIFHMEEEEEVPLFIG